MIILPDGRIQCRVKIIGSYRGEKFEYIDPENSDGSQFFSEDGDPSTYWWSEGNYSCDCNRSEFLSEELFGKWEKNSGINECGDEILIDEIVPLDYPDGRILKLDETKNGK